MNDSMDDQLRAKLDDYVTDLFAREDEILTWIQAEAARQELPTISVSPFEGRLLQMLVWMCGASKVVELGTLAGYSGVWIARALPENGRLYTLEKSAKHAAVARASFARAGVQNRVELLEGDAMQNLDQLSDQSPFDIVFLDADKTSYSHYLEWAINHLRPGGMVAAHNAFQKGRVLSPIDEADHIMRAFNEWLATDPRLKSMILAIGDGMAIGIKKTPVT